jgi:hypothetical protein
MDYNVIEYDHPEGSIHFRNTIERFEKPMSISKLKVINSCNILLYIFLTKITS